MNIDNIRLLAEVLQSYGLSRLEFSEGDIKISLEKEAVPAYAPSDNTTVPSEVPPVLKDSQTLDFNNIIEVKSPIVGVFYASPSPDTEPFVKVGSKVKKGEVLCIIEAMKLMNEITAESDGEIVDICVKDGDIAEYGQVLFKMF